MSKHNFMGIFLVSSILIAGCSQQGSGTPASSNQSSPVSVSEKAPLVLFNAYTAKTMNANGQAGAPTTAFIPGDKVYVGAVLHGEASSVAVKVKWSLVGGPAMGSVETILPVATSSVATLELTKGAPLASGNYRAIVQIDGKPSWELHFTVGK